MKLVFLTFELSFIFFRPLSKFEKTLRYFLNKLNVFENFDGVYSFIMIKCNCIGTKTLN